MTVNLFNILLIISFQCISFTIAEHRCIHDSYMNYLESKSLAQDTPQTVLAPQDYNVTYNSPAVNGGPPFFTQPLRIAINLDNINDDIFTCYKVGDTVLYTTANGTHICRAEDILTSEKKAKLVSLLDAAADFFRSYLLVMPLRQNLIIQSDIDAQDACDGVRIDPSYEFNGVPNADYVLFVTSRPSPSDTTLAYARYCQYDQIFPAASNTYEGRPVVGTVNIVPYSIDLSPQAIEMQLGIVRHEITHALGFMNYKFRNGFIKWLHSGSGWFPTSVSYFQIVVSYPSQSIGHQVTRVITPNVVNAARSHFGCSGLDGAELEDAGGDATAQSHWEQRVFRNEYMTGSSTPWPVYSPITFSLFKDMGWYGISPNISNLEPLLWGRNMGCPFVNGSCKEWPLTTEKEGYRCTADTTPRGQCRFDFKGWGQCNINFPDALDDGCLFYASTVRTGCEINTKLFKLTLDTGAVHEDKARCFHSSLSRFPDPLNSFVRSPQGTSMQCYNTTCSDPQTLKVGVESIWYDCPYEGGNIYPINFGGNIHCSPNMADVICVGYQNTTDQWPLVYRIEPRTANPGDYITVYGSNFDQNRTIVQINVECSDINVISPNKLVVRIPPIETFSSISALGLFFRRFSVIVWDDQGRNSHLKDAILINIPANGASIHGFFQNRFSVSPIVLSIVSSLILAILISGLIFWCYRVFPKKNERLITYQTVSLKQNLQ